MKKLIEIHVDEVAKNPKLDMERIRRVKYCMNSTERSKARPGDTLQKERTIATPHHPTHS